VVNLILCDDLDELVAGALSLHYSTFSQLNLKPNKVCILFNYTYLTVIGVKINPLELKEKNSRIF